MSDPSAFSTDNDTDPVISKSVVISATLQPESGSKYSKQDSEKLGLAHTDLSPKVRPSSSVSVELSARHEARVGDLVMEDRGQHQGLPGIVPAPALRVTQARPQPSAASVIPPPPPLLKIPSVEPPPGTPVTYSGKIH